MLPLFRFAGPSPHHSGGAEAARASRRPRECRSRPVTSLGSRRCEFVFGAAVVSLAALPCPVFAQTAQRLDAGGDAQDARTDAVLAMPSPSPTAPLSNLYSTSPGQEEQVPSAQFRANLIFPFGWNSNAEEVSHGGTQTLEISPLGNASIAAPIGPLLRFTATGFGEIDRFLSASNADLDKLGGSARLQYVDPNNDQAFSPYVAYAPRWEFAPTFSDQLSFRQDFNIGFNKRFNFDGGFERVAFSGDTSASTVWSFGLTVFGQQRLRTPQLSSDALFVIPSLSYTISENWSASLAVELLGRWYERDSTGVSSRDLETLPIVTVEYAIPASFFGGEKFANILGRPALDFQGSYLKVWSTVPGVSFDQWDAAVTIRSGWRF